MMNRQLLGILIAGVWLVACVNDNEFLPVEPDGGSVVCSDPTGDADLDGIPNGQEHCLSGLDSDGDGLPDWQDTDSDNDNIPDAIEAGAKSPDGKCLGKKPPTNGWPCDTDNDMVPDYLDVDSDGDALLDKNEDANGDGALGCCLHKCNDATSVQQKGCLLTDDGCGPGQVCKAGLCTPGKSFDCSDGETSPLLKDTFGDGRLDNERGTYICRDASEDNPKGRKPVKLSASKAGDWHVAMNRSAEYNELTLASPADREAAAVIDETDTKTEVAGLVISRVPQSGDVQKELSAVIEAITTLFGKGNVAHISSGAQGKTHDRFDTVQGTTLRITASTAQSVPSLRNELIGALLGRPVGDLGALPQPYGSSQTDFVLRFSTVRRFSFKSTDGKLEKDADGYPVDDGDASKWRLLVMGAVAGYNNYSDPSRHTGIAVEDLSNGTALAVVTDKVKNECDVGEIGGLPIADIIWVVDTSGSMSNNQADVANNAANFFSRALSSGLDFRMAVQPACETSKLCQGRFLLPSEQTTFANCIKQPGSGSCEKGLASASAAINNALPRSSGDQTKIRPEAKLVVIQVTDELPASAKSSVGYALNTCNLTPALQSSLATHLQKYEDQITGVSNPESAGQVHAIAGVCQNSCGAEIAHGYLELAQLTGGLLGDICQKDLGNTLQLIIDSIAAGSSPIQLEYVTIRSSLAVVLGGGEVARSRSLGFDYRSSNNALVFMGVKYQKGTEVIASYKRWARQEIIK